MIRDRRLVLALAGYLAFTLALYGTWLVITVVAFERGGADETGLVGAVLLVPGALAAPLFGALADRVRRDVVLAIGYAGFALATAASALAIQADAPRVAIYGAAALATACTTVPCPVLAAMLPAMTDSAGALITAVVGLEVVVNTAIFAGPLLAGLVLLGAGPATAMWLGAGLGAAALVSVLTLQMDVARLRPLATAAESRTLATAARSLNESSGSRLMLGLAIGAFFLSGALDVFFVTVALDDLGRSASFAAVLAAVNGLGGLLGAAGVGRLMAAHTSSRILSGCLVLVVAPLAALAASGEAIAVIAFLVNGAGLGGSLVAARSYLQRSTPDAMLARVFGLLEGSSFVALALGSLVAGLAAEAAGSSAPLLVGLTCLVAFGLTFRRLRVVDAALPTPDPHLVDVLRRDAILGHLPEALLARLASNGREVKALGGDVIVREGERGDRYYAVAEGRVSVATADGHGIVLGPGEGFGEVALVRDAPRNATVTALGPTTLVAVGRGLFLDAITGSSAASTAAESLTDDRS